MLKHNLYFTRLQFRSKTVKIDKYILIIYDLSTKVKIIKDTPLCNKVSHHEWRVFTWIEINQRIANSNENDSWWVAGWRSLESRLAQSLLLCSIIARANIAFFTFACPNKSKSPRTCLDNYLQLARYNSHTNATTTCGFNDGQI